MILHQIVDAIKRASVLRETEIVEELMGMITRYYGLKNRNNRDFEWTSNRTTDLLSSNKFPPAILSSMRLSDFGECIKEGVHVFLSENGYGPDINEHTLFMELKHIYIDEGIKSNSDAMTAETILYECLMYVYDCASKDDDQKSKKIRPFKIKTSLFVKIINEVIKCSNNNVKSKKKSIVYELKDKMNLNKIYGDFAKNMQDSFDLYFDAIENSFDTLSQLDYSIKTKFLTKMGDYYSDYKIQRQLKHGGAQYDIRDESLNVIFWIKTQVLSVLESNEKIDCYIEELPAYAMALVVYAFYRCRILIPVEAENDN